MLTITFFSLLFFALPFEVSFLDVTCDFYFFSLFYRFGFAPLASVSNILASDSVRSMVDAGFLD